MKDLLYVLPFLACPLGMGVMMLMMRGSHGRSTETPAEGHSAEEMSRLRAEVEQLRQQQQTTSAAQAPVRTT